MSTRPDVTFTFQDWLTTPDDGLRHEILDGDHVVTPPPELDHQRISRRIQFQLYEQIERTGRGEVFNAPAGVRLSDQDVFEPDLFVVLTERSQIMAKTHVEGAPDLIVEILSRGTGRRDHGLKKRRYEVFGVREYWIVDPKRRTVEQYLLKTSGYTLAGTHTARVSTNILPDDAVDLREVW